MTYGKIKEQLAAAGLTCPCNGTNKSGEPVVIEQGENEGGKFYRLTILQSNNWNRIEIYWEDGTVDTLYEK